MTRALAHILRTADGIDQPRWSLKITATECHLANERLAERIRLERPALMDEAMSPAAARSHLASLEARLRSPDAAPVVIGMHRWAADLLEGVGSEDPWRQWRLVARLVEAAWPLLRELAEVDADARMRLPLAARARFLVLSYPSRLRTVTCARVEPAFGTIDELTWRARRARDDWLGHLLGFQDRPLLAARGAPALDDDARLVVLNGQWPDGLPARRQLGLAAEAMDRVIARRVAEDLLLPRFMLTDAAWLGVDAFRRRWLGGLFLACWVVLLAVCLTLLPISVAVEPWRPELAQAALGVQGWLGVAAYALVAGGVVAVSPTVAYAACLRIPAVSALGLVALMSLFADRLHLVDWQPTAALLLLSLGYLAVEASNHGLGPAAALGRACKAWVLGLAHAVTVAAVAFALMEPVLPVQLTDTGVAEQVRAMAFAAAAGLALGVLLQVLWDERPITAPLSHLRWTDSR